MIFKRQGRQLKFPSSSAGLVSVEFVILAIGLLGGIYMVLFAGRVAQARGVVQDLASEAARLATSAQDVEAANELLREFVAATSQASSRYNSEGEISVAGLGSGSGTSCEVQLVSFGYDSFEQLLNGEQVSEQVEVRARCEVSLSDLVHLRVPGSTVIEATATEIIDRYRSG